MATSLRCMLHFFLHNFKPLSTRSTSKLNTGHIFLHHPFCACPLICSLNMKLVCTSTQLFLCPFLHAPTGNCLNCSTCVLALHMGTSEIAITWTQPTCSDVVPDHYLIQWVPEDPSTRVPVLTSDPIAISTSSNTYNISSLAPNTKYVISLLVVDVCGRMIAASPTARTNGECTGKRLFWICIGNFLCDFMLVMPPDPVWTCTYAWSSTKCSVRSVFGHDQS